MVLADCDAELVRVVPFVAHLDLVSRKKLSRVSNYF